MSKEHEVPQRDALLEEYRQLMESQRDNTRIAYSWIGNISLVLSSALFVVGLTTSSLSIFIPAMALSVPLAWIWVGITNVFAIYIRDRFDRLGTICDTLGISRVTPPRPGRLYVAKTYIMLLAIAYTLVWILRLILLIITRV